MKSVFSTTKTTKEILYNENEFELYGFFKFHKYVEPQRRKKHNFLT